VAKRSVVSAGSSTEALDKIANLLALLLTKDAKQNANIMHLSRAGFSDEEIAALLQTTKGVIHQTRYENKNTKRKKKKKPT
jgi:hypothetical protein